MGYDRTRFVAEVEEEFICLICNMVLEDPLCSICDHMFCRECIHSWLLQEECCPEDQKKVTVDQLKPPGRAIRNLLNKMIIKCDFEQQGCERLIMLEFLEYHSQTCEFNPNVVEVSDDSEASNLLNAEPSPVVIEEISSETVIEISSETVEEISSETVEEISSETTGEMSSAAAEEIAQVEEESAQGKEGTAQFGEESGQGSSKESVGIDISVAVEQSVNNNTHAEKQLHKSDSKWQLLHNFQSKGEIEEVESKSISAFAQLASAINPLDCSFKVQLLDFHELKYMAIGLSCRVSRIDKIPGLYADSVSIDSAGDFIFDRKSTKVGAKWSVGDIIECGIKFPANYNSSEHSLVKVYFSRNGKSVTEKKLALSRDGLFPTIYAFEGIAGSWWNKGVLGSMDTSNTKVKCFK